MLQKTLVRLILQEQCIRYESIGFLEAPTHFYKRVCPSVRPLCFVFNEPIMEKMVGNDLESSLNAPN